MTKFVPIRRCLLAGLAGSLAVASACAEKGGSTGKAEPAPAAPIVAAPAPEPAATPEQVESLKTMLTGSWKTTGTDPATGNPADYWMHIVPVTVEGVDNALYVEQARGDAPSVPYRQAVFQPYINRGKLRLRTIEFRSVVQDGGPWALAWLVPDLFPKIDAKNLIATLDLEFKPTAGGFDGKTPYPYPNADRGAVEMTSALSVSKDQLVSHDEGFGSDGSLAWGVAESLTWQRADPGFKVQRDDDGLVIITIKDPVEGAQPVDGDTMFLDYTLWLADGTMVDSSRKSGRLMPVQIPVQEGRLMPGFIRGFAGVHEGTLRRLIIPPSLGYGENPRGPIPGNSTLYFRVEVNSVQKPAPAEPEPAPGDQPPQGGDQPSGH